LRESFKKGKIGFRPAVRLRIRMHQIDEREETVSSKVGHLFFTSNCVKYGGLGAGGGGCPQSCSLSGNFLPVAEFLQSKIQHLGLKMLHSGGILKKVKNFEHPYVSHLSENCNFLSQPC